MDSDELHSDDSMADSKDAVFQIPNKNDKKNRRKRIHGKQKYRAAWEKEPEFQTWLHRDPSSEYRALCYACNTNFVSEKTVIRNHANGRKHKRMNALYNSSKLNIVVTKHQNTAEGSSDIDFLGSDEDHPETSSKDIRYHSRSTLESTPAHKTIFISTASSDLPIVSKSENTIPDHPASKTEEAELKLSNFLRDLGISRRNAYKLNQVVKQCFSDSKIAQKLNLNYNENNMGDHGPFTCRDSYYRDSDPVYLGNSFHNRPTWVESPPTKLCDQLFATGLWPDEVPTGTSSLYLRSRRTPREKSGFSVINETNDKFTIHLEVPHFLPDELKVRVTEDVLEIEGKHDERQDDHGTISRHFKRKYSLPDDIMVDQIGSSLSPEGVLTIEAPRKPPESARPLGREVPIKKMRSLQ